jgi:uncharacterized protein
MNHRDIFSIPLKGMNHGLHEYNFEVESAFFQSVENSLISEGKFNIKVVNDIREDMYVLDFEVQGTFKAPCDRCLVTIDVPCKTEYRIFLKFSGSESELFDDEDNDIIYVDEKENRFDLSNLFYQLIVLSMPLSNTYDCENDKNPKCDFVLLEKLQNSESIEQDINPELNKLKDIFKNKK